LAAVVTGENEVYLWRTDGSLPLKVGAVDKSLGDQYRHPRWSPDSRLLAFMTAENNNVWPHSATVRVVDHLGQTLVDFQIGGGTDFEDIYWLASDVVCRYDRNSIPCHKASTGQYLFDIQGWHILTSGGVPAQQPPSFSLDQQWCLLDVSYYDYTDTSDSYRAVYQLYDIQRVQEYALPSSGSNPVAFAGWSEDSSTAYLISLPRDADALPAPDVPFGLLRLDVQTRRFEVVFEEAVHVAWSPDHQWAFVIFPGRAADGSLGLAGRIWRVGTETLSERTLISEAMIYGNPGWDSYFRGPDSFGAPTWSHEGAWVVFGTAHGKLYLGGIDGAVRELAADETGASWLTAEFTWSPDDQHLLVQYGDRAWIMSVP
jgi:hypothetical protein